MASDNRDWYRDWWRKKTGYVERAKFRQGAHEIKRQEHREGWRANGVVLVLLCLALVVVYVARKVL
jgi:hypothetical protein